jgi:probable HAF family extracellular repeat protein
MRYSSSVVLITAMSGCSIEAEVTAPSASEAVLQATATYQIAKLPSLGGTLSRGMAINDRGIVAGWSNRADGLRHAALWRDGVITDLLTLGGPSSTVAWPGLNDQGTVVGISQTTDVDPFDEDWSCEAGGFLPNSTNLACRARG